MRSEVASCFDCIHWRAFLSKRKLSMCVPITMLQFISDVYLSLFFLWSLLFPIGEENWVIIYECIYQSSLQYVWPLNCSTHRNIHNNISSMLVSWLGDVYPSDRIIILQGFAHAIGRFWVIWLYQKRIAQSNSRKKMIFYFYIYE